jgi:hypothetical protein
MHVIRPCFFQSTFLRLDFMMSFVKGFAVGE